VLVNAIYFKGTWQATFNPNKTKKMDFYAGGDQKKSVDMMNIESKFKYAEFEDVRVLELPYAGDEISMIVALPNRHDASKVEASLSYEVFKKWESALAQAKVSVFLPKFKIHCKYSLKKPLVHLGMPLAFEENKADFSKMTGKKDLCISDVRRGRSLCDKGQLEGVDDTIGEGEERRPPGRRARPRGCPGRMRDDETSPQSLRLPQSPGGGHEDDM
jgi:serine protease inhibitor